MIGNSGLTRLAIVSVTLVALASVNAAAQEPPPPSIETTPEQAPAPASGPARPGTAEFARIVGGRKVTVTTVDGQQYKGSFTPSGLFAGSFAPVPAGQIVKVERVTNRVVRNLIIGLGAGVGVGVLSLFISCEDECSTAGMVVPMFVGAGLGAAIGAAQKKTDVLYDAKRTTTRTMSFAPILSKTRKGAMFSMTWR